MKPIKVWDNIHQDEKEVAVINYVEAYVYLWTNTEGARATVQREFSDIKSNEKQMRYFEVQEPYYALLKAEDLDHAKLEYNASVAFLEESDEIEEVKEDYALAKFSQAKDEDGNLISVKEILEEFRKEERCLLLIDGTLL